MSWRDSDECAANERKRSLRQEVEKAQREHERAVLNAQGHYEQLQRQAALDAFLAKKAEAQKAGWI